MLLQPKTILIGRCKYIIGYTGLISRKIIFVVHFLIFRYIILQYSCNNIILHSTSTQLFFIIMLQVALLRADQACKVLYMALPFRNSIYAKSQRCYSKSVYRWSLDIHKGSSLPVVGQSHRVTSSHSVHEKLVYLLLCLSVVLRNEDGSRVLL